MFPALSSYFRRPVRGSREWQQRATVGQREEELERGNQSGTESCHGQKLSPGPYQPPVPTQPAACSTHKDLLPWYFPRCPAAFQEIQRFSRMWHLPSCLFPSQTSASPGRPLSLLTLLLFEGKCLNHTQWCSGATPSGAGGSYMILAFKLGSATYSESILSHAISLIHIVLYNCSFYCNRVLQAGCLKSLDNTEV